MNRSIRPALVALLATGALAPAYGSARAQQTPAQQPVAPPAAAPAANIDSILPIPGKFRVCADPNALPYSNEALQGFENRLAELIARDFHATVSYTWYPQRRGFVRNTLRDNQCDVVMGIPSTVDMVLTTIHTNDAPGAITRLVDMGVEPFLISSTLMAVLGQRLVRPSAVRFAM